MRWGAALGPFAGTLRRLSTIIDGPLHTWPSPRPYWNIYLADSAPHHGHRSLTDGVRTAARLPGVLEACRPLHMHEPQAVGQRWSETDSHGTGRLRYSCPGSHRGTWTGIPSRRVRQHSNPEFAWRIRLERS